MVYTLLAEGFEEIEALTVVDILRRANVSVQLVSADNAEWVVGGHGIRVQADTQLNAIDVGDMLFIPGGMPGVTNLEQNPAVISCIEKHMQAQKWVAAICAAPKILGNMHVLQNRHAVCYPGFEAELKGAHVLEDGVVQDGTIITSKGAGTAADLAFHLVTILKDEQTAEQLREGMMYA